YWVVKMTLTTVRKSNNRHVLSLQWCCTPSNTCVKKLRLNSFCYELQRNEFKKIGTNFGTNTDAPA
ncbi:hypothetical protein, partial [Vibrio cholerae]|uniref:hypothetical protein n=1 Tax=Vibrio cholerae TaxID=666 RepID=UPI001C8CF7CB